jgi:hypothetical protein
VFWKVVADGGESDTTPVYFRWFIWNKTSGGMRDLGGISSNARNVVPTPSSKTISIPGYPHMTGKIYYSKSGKNYTSTLALWNFSGTDDFYITAEAYNCGHTCGGIVDDWPGPDTDPFGKKIGPSGNELPVCSAKRWTTGNGPYAPPALIFNDHGVQCNPECQIYTQHKDSVGVKVNMVSRPRHYTTKDKEVVIMSFSAPDSGGKKWYYNDSGNYGGQARAINAYSKWDKKTKMRKGVQSVPACGPVSGGWRGFAISGWTSEEDIVENPEDYDGKWICLRDILKLTWRNEAADGTDLWLSPYFCQFRDSAGRRQIKSTPSGHYHYKSPYEAFLNHCCCMKVIVIKSSVAPYTYDKDIYNSNKWFIPEFKSAGVKFYDEAALPKKKWENKEWLDGAAKRFKDHIPDIDKDYCQCGEGCYGCFSNGMVYDGPTGNFLQFYVRSQWG